MILSRQMTQTCKGSTTSDTFFPVYPLFSQPTHSSSKGEWCLRDCRRQSQRGWGRPPGSSCSCPPRQRWQPHTGPGPKSRCPPIPSLLALPGKNANTVTCSPHSHSHSQAQKLWSPPRGSGPATLLYLSMRSPPETDLHPRWAPWLLPWRTSSPTSHCICSWKDWPKCKTNAIFQEPSGGRGKNKAKTHSESKPEHSVTCNALQKRAFKHIIQKESLQGVSSQNQIKITDFLKTGVKD